MCHGGHLGRPWLQVYISYQMVPSLLQVYISYQMMDLCPTMNRVKSLLCENRDFPTRGRSRFVPPIRS